MLQFQDVLSICKIECWCEITLNDFGKCGSLIWSKIYIVISVKGGWGQDLDIRLTFRIEFLISE